MLRSARDKKIVERDRHNYAHFTEGMGQLGHGIGVMLSAALPSAVLPPSREPTAPSAQVARGRQAQAPPQQTQAHGLSAALGSIFPFNR